MLVNHEITSYLENQEETHLFLRTCMLISQKTMMQFPEKWERNSRLSNYKGKANCFS